MAFNSKISLRQHILDKGCYDPQENERIYDKWFAPGPRHQFQAVNRKYHFTDKVICDIGCGYGVNLLRCQPGSYGIEVDQYAVKFARSIGLTIHDIDFMLDRTDELPKVDAVWCSALLEHVESIHIFLRKLALILKPGGLVAIYVPTIPLVPHLRYVPKLKRHATGYLYSDHINAFTPSTLQFFCERAGYETLEVSPFMPGPLAVLNPVPLLNRIIGGVTFVGRRLPNWDYPHEATRRAVEHGQGFEYKEWFEDGAKKTESTDETA
ncbi:MAG: class I SAM-dependent methyltransferase [Anaerolineae bacterium]|nr:class I SAM-dependent methyltransferase [Anaerolineae bacterium]